MVQKVALTFSHTRLQNYKMCIVISFVTVSLLPLCEKIKIEVSFFITEF